MGFPISLTRSKNIALYNRITLRHCNLSPTSSDTENDKSNNFNPALNLAIRWATLSFRTPRTGTRKSSHPRKRAKTCPAETRRFDDLASWRLMPSVFSNSRVPLSLYAFWLPFLHLFPPPLNLWLWCTFIVCAWRMLKYSQIRDSSGGEADTFSRLRRCYRSSLQAID